MTYRLYETGQLVIAGVGPMRDVQYYQISPWFSKSDKIYGVRIKEGVTHIGGWTFSNCKNLKSVSIPDSVTSIGDYAFRSCARLKSVSVPAKLKIGRGAFPWRTKVTRREKP